ncbi:MAG: hypothetical protein IJV69_02885 [Kiritimatiellae bacterium]|nr:hypothetical protein [Kiritimatiellia bacterium]
MKQQFYRVRLLRYPFTTWDCLATSMSDAKAQVLTNEPHLKAGDLGVSVPGGRPTFPEDDE